MFGLGRNGNGPLYGALIDVGSGTIGVAIVSSDLGNKLPTIIYQNRVTMRVGKHTGADDESLRRVREMLLSTSLMLSQEGYEALRRVDEKARITELCVTVSSPWSYTVVHNVEYKDDEPFKVSQTILQDLVDSAESAIIAHVRENAGAGKEAFEIVERATVGVTINEYPVPNPIHMEGTVLGLSHVAGLIPTKILESIHEIQDKLFSQAKLHAHTSMLSMYSVVADLFPRTHSFCIIDVTAEATEFGIVEDDTLMENSFVRSGTNSFLKDVIGKAERPLADIETSLRAWNDKTVSRDADVLAALETYGESVKEGVTKILERRAFPLQVILITHEPFKEAFTDAVEKALKSSLGKKVNVVSVNEHLIEEISHGTGKDVYLALAARFFHKLHEREEHK